MNRITDPFNYNQDLLHWVNDLADRGIFTTDAQLNIQSWNHWLELYSGLNADRVVGQNLLEIYPELKHRRLDRFFDQALAGQVAVLSQRLHGFLLPMLPADVYKDVPYMLQSAKIAPIVEASRVIGTIATLEDVTERVLRESELHHQIKELKRTESALMATQSQLQYLLSSSPAVIYTCPAKQPYSPTFVSENIVEHLGYRPEEIVGDCSFWRDRIHPDDAPELFSSIKLLYQRGHSQSEYRFWHPEGSYRWVRDEMKLICKGEHQVEEIVGALYDITDRKRVEEQVRQQAALLDIATDAIWVKDLNQTIQFWNKGAEKLYGWTREEASAQSSSRLFEVKSAEELNRIEQTVLTTGEWHGELEQITKAGKSITVASRQTLVRDDRDRPCSILSVNTDITEKKQLEAQFLRAQRLESIGTLASGIAHDLNNILTPILGAVQLLQMFPLNAQQMRLISMLEINTLRGADLLKQVLSFAKGLDGDRTLLQIKHLIDETTAIARETFPKSIEITTAIDPQLWLISGDPTHLHQILMNLCVNARDAMPNGGILSIEAENLNLTPSDLILDPAAQVGSYIKLTIRDTGTGISPEILDRLFEPFFTTKALGQGTGLGLPTVRGIVKNHGGFLLISSQLGQGTAFTVYLPAIQGTEALASEPQELPFGAGELILVVDDEVAICEIAQALLQKFGYHVLTANDGMEAISLYSQRSSEIAVVILDMMMPFMDGMLTLKALQKINSSVKVIAISGLLSNFPLAELGDDNSFTYLSKPYKTRDLLCLIRKQIEQ
ncbi:hybrid sensor histidine kinase/response regulator [Oscillatoria acuminata]|uniref:histidine kinase n=1 Tax=Oscillatoria acuminata PCC 6304 TaxID=56110 RepID=K9TIY8_9CYAN|nr:PAS domain S-box protein [Oscillatoria acuminata]AFY82787.1 PAS domain S-box [Oscillatoria acuminata PCC 6304]